MLSNEQKNILLQIIDNTSFNGKDIEKIVEIKKELEKEIAGSKE